MRNIFRNKPLMISFAAILLLLILAFASSGDRKLTFVESFAGGILQPVQTFSSAASQSIIDFVRSVFNTTDLDMENQQLQVRVSQLEQSVSEMEMLRKENQRLQELLDFAKSTPDLQYIACSIIARSPSIWFDTFTLNVGRTKGVEKNMPVVNSKGLVGRVTSVGATYCKVVSVIDQSMSVSVMVDRTRDAGMIRGLLEAGNEIDTLELFYLPADSDLMPGDKIVTSGIGGIYPKGLPVGEVREVTRAGAVERNATVTPYVDFRHLEEVMIIVGMKGQEEGDLP